MKRLRVGLSTCPNDTFAFHHLMGRTGADGADSIEWVLDDIQSLNERMAAGELDIAKVSFASAARHGGELTVLPVGAALGFGVGPVVLTANGCADDRTDARVLTPGADTTAHLLWRIFRPHSTRVEHTVFSAIVPALERGDADLGVCIHEARFTYAEHGLALALDLGATWEAATGLPLPLGGLAVRRELARTDPGAVSAFVCAARASIRAARADERAPLPTMRRYAQEFDDDVLLQHADLYVNDWTEELGSEGRAALRELAEKARACGFTERDGGLDPFEPDERLFHFVAPADWERAQRHGEWQPPSLDSEGFVHLSFRHQIEGTLDVHFAGVDEVLLVEIEPDDLRQLVIEPSRGGALFPHLYRQLRTAEAVRTHHVVRGPGGWTGLPPA
jgi:1,4-dihydroxy-6-naphthoate synthase